MAWIGHLSLHQLAQFRESRDDGRRVRDLKLLPFEDGGRWSQAKECGWTLKEKEEREATQSCPTLCNPMDYSLPGSTVQGIFRARILEWVAISFSRRSSRPRDRTVVSHVVGRRFTV